MRDIHILLETVIVEKEIEDNEIIIVRAASDLETKAVLRHKRYHAPHSSVTPLVTTS